MKKRVIKEKMKTQSQKGGRVKETYIHASIEYRKRNRGKEDK